MKTESYIRILAGSMVLLSLGLSLTLSVWWLLLAAFVAVNLIQSAFTGFCPAVNILHALHLGDASRSGGCGCNSEGSKR